MAYRKKSTPKKVIKVFNRVVVMNSIDTKLGKPVTYGVATPVTTASLSAKEKAYIDYQDQYNLHLAQADTLRKTLSDLQKDILNDSDIVTTSAAAIFGLEGIELVDLGIKRKKDRKRPKKNSGSEGDVNPAPSKGK